MGYKSLKRVMGETTLERKCRLLFGTCLTIFIFGAFYGVDRIAEQLVMSATRNNGRNVVSMMLVRAHDSHLVTNEEVLTKGLLSEIDRQNEDIKYDVLSIDRDIDMKWIEPRYLPLPSEPPEAGNTKAPLGLDSVAPIRPSENEPHKMRDVQKLAPEELAKLREVVEDLKKTWQQRQEFDENGKPKPIERGQVWSERPVPRRNEYQYFEPIHLSANCALCHLEVSALSAADGSTIQGAATPFIVMRVSLPYGETAAAINRTRAILITVAILTVFVAMIALYVIIRYLVVKPLKHLRDVSDDVSRGHTEVRAEIQTNDEFEELASSYNRMLRHLTDTQTALQGANEDLDGKVDQLAQLSMRLYEMNRLKNDFLANMSHELRTPLNSIIGFSEVLQGIESLSDKQKRYAENIQKSGRVLLEMINDILDLAKMEAGKMDVRPSEFQLDVIIKAQCDMVRSLTEEKNIDLDVNVSDKLPAVYQDQAKFQQILTNLLSNAIKFTPEGGRITVTATRRQDMLELSVADTGVGIADEDREVIFEKFRQGAMALGQDNLTREYSGTGLGLSILKELCKLMNGEVTFDSRLGIGSTFRVAIPWEHTEVSQVGSSVAHKLEELEQKQRFDLERQSLQTPTEPSDIERREAV